MTVLWLAERQCPRGRRVPMSTLPSSCWLQSRSQSSRRWRSQLLDYFLSLVLESYVLLWNVASSQCLWATLKQTHPLMQVSGNPRAPLTSHTEQSDRSWLRGSGPRRKRCTKRLRSRNPRLWNNLLLGFLPRFWFLKTWGFPLACSSLITVAFDYEKCSSRTWQGDSLPVLWMCQNPLNPANSDCT